MKLQLIIDVKQEGEGFKASIDGVNKLKTAATGAHDAGGQAAQKHSQQVFSLSTNIMMAYAKYQLLKMGIESLIAPFRSVIETGVKFNALLQTSQLGIAAIIAQVGALTDANGRLVTGQEKFNRAQEIAIGIQKELMIAARTTAATYEQLLNGLQAALPLAVQRGFDTRQITEFVKLVSQAAAAIDPLLLHEGQFAQEIRGLFEGDLSRMSRLSRVVFSDFAGNAEKLRAKLSELQGQGKLFDFMRERLTQFGEAGTRSLNTLTVASSNFKDFYQQATGEATRKLTEALADSLNKIVDAFTYVDAGGKRAFSPQLIETINNVATAVSDVVGMLTAMVQQMAKLMDYYNELKNPPKTLGDRDSLIRQLGQKEKEFALQQFQAGDPTGERSAALAEINRLKAEIARLTVQLHPQTAQGRGEAEQFLRQLTGGATLQNFGPDLSQYGQRLIDLSKSNPQQYLATIREISKAAKDGTLTQLEYAKALTIAQRALTGGTGLGKGQLEVDDKMKAQRAAMEKMRADLAAMLELRRDETRLLELETDKIGLQQRQLVNTQALEAESLRAGGIRLDQRTKELLLAHQMLAVREVELQKTIALQNAEKQHARELKRIDDEERENKKRDPKFRLPATEFEAQRGAEAVRYASAIRQINAQTELELDQARQKEKKYRSDLFADHRKLMDMRIAGEDALTQKQAENLQKLQAAYEEMFGAIAQGGRDAMLSIFEGKGLTPAFQQLADSFRRTWAGMFGQLVDDWLKNFRAKAFDRAVPRMMPDGQGGFKAVTDAEGNQVYDIQKADPRYKAGFTGLQGAVALYGLYASGQQGATRGQNALSGAMQGAMMGATYSIPGAIIGAVVGAIAGYLTGKDKSSFMVTTSGGKISVAKWGGSSQGQADAALTSINEAIAGAGEGVRALFGAFPTAIAQTMTKLKPGDIFKAQGSRWFTPETLKAFIEQELPKQLFEAYVPQISGGLSAMGVTGGRITELVSMAKTKDPRQAFDFIRTYVEAFVTLRDRVEFLGKGMAGKTATALAELNKTAPERMADISTQILDLAKGFADLDLQDQIARAGQINEKLTARYELELQYLNEIQQTQKAVAKSFLEAAFGLSMGESTPTQQFRALQARRFGVIEGLGAAKTPADVRELADEFTNLTQQMYAVAKGLRDALKEVLGGFDALEKRKAADADAKLSPTERLAKINDKIAELADGFDSLTSEDKVTRSRELLDLANQYYDIQKQALEALAQTAENIHQSITDQIFGIKFDQLRENPQAQINMLLEEQRKYYAQIQRAMSPEELAFLAQRIQQNASQLYELQGKSPEAAGRTVNMLEELDKAIQERTKQLSADWKAHDDELKGRLDGVVGNIQTTVTTLDDVMKSLIGDFETFSQLFGGKLYEMLETAMTADAALFEALNPVLTAFGDSAQRAGDEIGGLAGEDGPIRRFGRGLDAVSEKLEQMASFSNRLDSGAKGELVAAAAAPAAANVTVILGGSAERLIDHVEARIESNSAERMRRSQERTVRTMRGRRL